MAITITLKNFDKFKKHLRNRPKVLKRASREYLSQAGSAVENSAKRNAPVFKKQMVEDIQKRKAFSSKGMGVTVGVHPGASTYSYAQHVHGGTGRFKGGRDYGIDNVKWNRMRTEYTKRKSRSGNTWYQANFPSPGGIRPDKFMNRGVKLAKPIFRGIEKRLLDKYLNKS